MAEPTKALLRSLRDSSTDLWRLIERVERQRSSVVYVSREAATAWERRAPAAWAATRQWLEARGAALVLVPENTASAERFAHRRVRRP